MGITVVVGMKILTSHVVGTELKMVVDGYNEW